MSEVKKSAESDRYLDVFYWEVPKDNLKSLKYTKTYNINPTQQEWIVFLNSIEQQDDFDSFVDGREAEENRLEHYSYEN